MHQGMTKKWSSEGYAYGRLPWEAEDPGPDLALTLGPKSWYAETRRGHDGELPLAGP